MKLADWMIAEGMDDDELARRANRHRSTISRVRRGLCRPSHDLVAVLFVLSAGRVRAEDWFDLPALPASERQAA